MSTIWRPLQLAASTQLWPCRLRNGISNFSRSFCIRVSSAIAQFSHTLDKNTATQLSKLLNEYCPESKEEEGRLDCCCCICFRGEGEGCQGPLIGPFLVLPSLSITDLTSDIVVVSRTPRNLSSSNTADPIELVVFFPALCHKMGVLCVIERDKARLGTVVEKKTVAVVALQEAKK